MRKLSTARRAVLSLTAVVLVALIAYAGYWHVMAGQLRDGLVPWAEQAQAQGYLVRWDDAQVGGFPGAFRFDFTNLSFGAARPLPVAVNAGAASVWAMPWNLKHWEFTAPQGARIGEPTGIAGFAIGHLDGALDVGGAATNQLDLTALNLTGIGLAEGVIIGDAEAHIEVPNSAPRGHADTALAVALELGATKMRQGVAGFGNNLTSFAFAAQMKGGLPPGPFAAALDQWRQDGGTIELQSLRLRWGSLLLDASGTLALDSALQPEGAFSAIITGQDAAVDVAVMTGSLKPNEAGVAKAFLGLLAKPAADGQTAITLPLTVQDQRLFLGPAKIADLPRISWK